MPISKEVMLATELNRLMDQTDIGTMLSVMGYLCGERSSHLAPTDAANAKIWLRLAVGLDKLNKMVEEARL